MLAHYQNVATFAENFGESMIADLCSEVFNQTSFYF